MWVSTLTMSQVYHTDTSSEIPLLCLIFNFHLNLSINSFHPTFELFISTKHVGVQHTQAYGTDIVSLYWRVIYYQNLILVDFNESQFPLQVNKLL